MLDFRKKKERKKQNRKPSVPNKDGPQVHTRMLQWNLKKQSDKKIFIGFSNILRLLTQFWVNAQWLISHNTNLCLGLVSARGWVNTDQQANIWHLTCKHGYFTCSHPAVPRPLWLSPEVGTNQDGEPQEGSEAMHGESCRGGVPSEGF